MTAVDEILSMQEDDVATIELKQKIGDMVVPFCVLLQTQNIDAEKHETAFFHLINANAKPLTSEENLKTILDSDLFAEDEIEEILGSDAKTVKKIVKSGLHSHCTGINKIIEKNYRAICLELLKLLNEENKSVDNILESIKTVDRLYNSDSRIKDNESIGLLIALLYYQISDSKKNNLFKEWIINNHLFEINETKAKSIIKIYDKITEKKSLKLFVAMPYYSYSEINEFNKLYKEICIDVSKKAKMELELIPIMRFRGKSQRIDQRLLEKINECDIFIADITENNINVIFEVGYAESKDLPMILLKNESDKTIVPFDMDKLQYLPFPNKGYYNDIKLKVTGNILEILRKDFNLNA